MINKKFYEGKKVFVTGHTGFKGTWLTMYLLDLGAIVCGYSLEPNSKNELFKLSNVEHKIRSIYGDIRDYDKLKSSIDSFKPDIIIHLAAQPIVLDSYKRPKYTYETNVLGTLNLMECIRGCDSIKSVLNVTTEKVYENKELADYMIDESSPLDGFDPYSNSKSCSELITATYKRCFFKGRDVSVSTARTSNVLGGGDFADNRIIPDCVRAGMACEDIIIRHPNSCRPYQYILDPLSIYLEICEKQWSNKKIQGSYNVCPDSSTNTQKLVELFCQYWGEKLSWKTLDNNNVPFEATSLLVSNEKLKRIFGWKQVYTIEETIESIVKWSKIYKDNKKNIEARMHKEINIFLRKCVYE